MNDQSGNWHRVASRGEVSADEPKQVKVGNEVIGLYELDGDYFAIHDICTHEFACLSDGFVEDGAIECPIHQARFDIRTGKVLEPPATEDVKSYRVKVEGDDIFIEVPGA